MPTRLCLPFSLALLLFATVVQASEFRPSRTDVENYCAQSGRIYIKAVLMSQQEHPDTVKGYINSAIRQTTFINSTFNSPQMKEFTAGKLFDDISLSQKQVAEYMALQGGGDQAGKEELLITAFQDGCVRGFFVDGEQSAR